MTAKMRTSHASSCRWYYLCINDLRSEPRQPVERQARRVAFKAPKQTSFTFVLMTALLVTVAFTRTFNPAQNLRSRMGATETCLLRRPTKYIGTLLPMWRNWQTGQTQNLVLARVCGFDPLRRHHFTFWFGYGRFSSQHGDYSRH